MANLGILFATNLILHQSASPANVCSALSVPSNISRALIWKRTLLVLHFISSTVSTQHSYTLSIFQIYWHLLFYASSSHPRLQPFSLTPTVSYEGSLERELAFVCVDLSGTYLRCGHRTDAAWTARVGIWSRKPIRGTCCKNITSPCSILFYSRHNKRGVQHSVPSAAATQTNSASICQWKTFRIGGARCCLTRMGYIFKRVI